MGREGAGLWESQCSSQCAVSPYHSLRRAGLRATVERPHRLLVRHVEQSALMGGIWNDLLCGDAVLTPYSPHQGLHPVLSCVWIHDGALCHGPAIYLEREALLGGAIPLRCIGVRPIRQSLALRRPYGDVGTDSAGLRDDALLAKTNPGSVRLRSSGDDEHDFPFAIAGRHARIWRTSCDSDHPGGAAEALAGSAPAPAIARRPSGGMAGNAQSAWNCRTHRSA